MWKLFLQLLPHCFTYIYFLPHYLLFEHDDSLPSSLYYYTKTSVDYTEMTLTEDHCVSLALQLQLHLSYFIFSHHTSFISLSQLNYLVTSSFSIMMQLFCCVTVRHIVKMTIYISWSHLLTHYTCHLKLMSTSTGSPQIIIRSSC